MYSLNEEMKQKIFKTILQELGISYENFEKLSFDEQQQLIDNYHDNKVEFGRKRTHIIGDGEDSMIIPLKGKRVLVGNGEDACFIGDKTRKRQKTYTKKFIKG